VKSFPFAISLVGLTVAVLLGCGGSKKVDSNSKSVTLLNFSYDPTRELWEQLNQAFARKYLADKGITIELKQSHGGSGSQARAILDGVKADVATLSLWIDTDAIRKEGLIAEGWENKFPNRSLPYVSTVVFVTRKGNPKGIKDWPDIIKPGVEIITPNPKTSGNGRLSFLAAWGSVLATGGTEADALKFVTQMYKQVPTLDNGARGSTTTFSQKGIGDVHLTMESEAYLELAESGGNLEIVYPPRSILHEPHIAIVDKVVDSRGTRQVAEDYLNFLYTTEGQQIIARNHFRPIDPKIISETAKEFPAIELLPLSLIAPDWTAAQEKFFATDAIFDQLYRPTKK
jgi:sulfate/thiosulfate transport system substrate-binding protein